jgi:hypothetical protein
MNNCPNCNNAYETSDEVCRICGSILPLSTAIIPAGKILQTRYEIQDLVHSGGMGYVYLATDKRLYDRLCIVKQIKEPIKSDTHRKKLEEEALRMAKLNHPNVAMILDHFIDSGYYFLVVERIHGKTLSEAFKEHRGRLTEDEVVSWAISMCDVVSYLHKEGVVHRDISPDNIMLTGEGSIKFIDFGTLRELRYIAPGGTVGMGKYGYTPPEQWQGKPEFRSDIFALGATIYYLLTGFLPLSREYLTRQTPQKDDFNPSFPPIRTKNHNISPQLEAVLQKALRLEVNDRYSSVAEFGESLRDLMKTEVKKKTKVIEKAKDIKKAEVTKKTKVTKKTTTDISASADYSANVAPVKTDKVITKPGNFWGGAVLLAIGSINGAFVTICAIYIKEDWWIIPLLLVLSVVPFIIPGILLLRRNMATGQQDMPAGNVSNLWWSVVLGFIGGIISFMKQKDINRRKAMNMLTLGILLMFILPTLINGINILSYKPPPAAIEIDSSPINFTDLNINLSETGSQNRTISNTGGQSLTGLLTSDKTWLLVSPVQLNVAAGSKQDIKIWADTKGLTNNFSDTGLISIKTNGGEKQIPVYLTTSGAIFEDDFSNPNSGWFTASPEGTEFAYEDGKYSVSIKKANWGGWGTPPTTRIGVQKDFTAEVDVRSLSEVGNDAAGVVFRVQQEEQDKYNYYAFLVSSTSGNYAIRKGIKNEWAPNLKNFTPSSYINKGANTNQLKVVCQGSQIEVYANGYKLATVTDSSLTSGYVGLAVETFTSPNAHYHFDNFKLYAAK